MGDAERIEPAGTDGSSGARRRNHHLLWRFVRWTLVFELLLLWVVLFAPGALLLFLTAGVAALSAVALVTTVTSAWPRGGADTPK